jgi:hypothetical protein
VLRTKASRPLPPSFWLALASVLAFNLLGLAAFFWLARHDWPGAPSRCLKDFVCYCERPRPGLVRQPFNTWSNLVNVPLALWLSWDGFSSGHRSLGLTFAFIASAESLASMFFHGSLTTWGAMLDGVVLLLPVSLVLAVNLLRMRRIKERHLPLWLALCVAIAFGYRLLVPFMAPLVAVAVVGVIGTERRARSFEAAKRRSAWFLRAVALLAVAVAVWALSLLPGFPLCSGLFPWGHALWHVLVALVLGAIWLHTRSTLESPGNPSRLPG